jgi:hypothetical protein
LRGRVEGERWVGEGRKPHLGWVDDDGREREEEERLVRYIPRTSA